MIVKQCGFWDEVYLVSATEGGGVIGKFVIISDVPGERPQGHVLDEVFPGALSLWGVHIDEELRGRGYGNVLMEDVIHALGNKDCWLSVERDNYVAQSLYERHGFTHICDMVSRPRNDGRNQYYWGNEPDDKFVPGFHIMYREV